MLVARAEYLNASSFLGRGQRWGYSRCFWEVGMGQASVRSKHLTVLHDERVQSDGETRNQVRNLQDEARASRYRAWRR